MAVELFHQFLVSSLVLFLIVHAENYESDDRIVGGWPTTIEKYPFLVLFFGTYTCGGSVLAASWVLTANHCVDKDMTRIMYGHSDLADRFKTKDVARVEKTFKLDVPPDPNGIFTGMDYPSLLKLKQPIPTFGTQVKAAKLPPQGFEIIGSDKVDIYVSGWGATEEGSNSPSTMLLETVVKAVANEDCELLAIGDRGKIPKWFLCGGYKKGGRDACKGDSGGPAVLKDGTLVGAVSFGKGCGSPNISGGYFKVSYFIDQIEKITELKRSTDGYLK